MNLASKKMLLALLFAGILAVSGDHLVRADAPSAGEDAVMTLLKRYENAITNSNPMLLVSLQAPETTLFNRLIQSERFDEIRECRVKLDNVVTEALPDKAWRVTFRRTTEELFLNGLFQRTFAWIEMELSQQDEGGLRIRSHRMIIPEELKGTGYDPSDATTWSEPYFKSERMFNLGLEQFRRGDVDQAAASMAEAAASLEGDNLPLFMMGPSYFTAELAYLQALIALAQDKRSEAYAYVDQAIAGNLAFPLALNLAARLNFDDGQLDKATRLWEESATADPGQEDVTALAGYLVYARALEDEPLREALLAAIDAPPSQVLDLLEPLARKNKRDQFLLQIVARAHFNNGNPAKALAVLERLPGKLWNPETHYLVARAQLLLGQEDRALEAFRRTWELSPGYRDTLTYLIEIPAAQGRVMEARSAAEEGLAVRGNSDAQVLARIGFLDFNNSRVFEATSNFKKAMEAGIPAGMRRPVAGVLQKLAEARR